MTPQPIESQAVDKVAEDYRRRGYEVAVRPEGRDLPEFLEGHAPDIIARGPNESVVVDIKVGTRSSVTGRLHELAERVSRQPGWRLSVVFVNPSQPDHPIEAAPARLDQLVLRARQADGLLAADQLDAAFLLYWSSLEGGMRLVGRQAHLPLENLPASAVIRDLYSGGELSHDEFQTLLRLLPVRNFLVHGQEGRVDRGAVESLRDVVRNLLESASAEEGEPS
jgi:REase_AHJR-like protein